MAIYRFEVSTHLGAPAPAVWDRVVSPEGINDEMRPLLKMTIPSGIDRLDIDHVELGKPIGTSWILLFGLIPIDYDKVTLSEIEDGRRFLERSPMLSMRHWQHERIVEPATGPEGGPRACVVTDRIELEPRLPFLAKLMGPIFHRFFRHRHARLVRRFGA